jgi:hypothetical protein
MLKLLGLSSLNYALKKKTNNQGVGGANVVAPQDQD